eukprot:g69774.t1
MGSFPKEGGPRPIVLAGTITCQRRTVAIGRMIPDGDSAVTVAGVTRIQLSQTNVMIEVNGSCHGQKPLGSHTGNYTKLSIMSPDHTEVVSRWIS